MLLAPVCLILTAVFNRLDALCVVHARHCGPEPVSKNSHQKCWEGGSCRVNQLGSWQSCICTMQSHNEITSFDATRYRYRFAPSGSEPVNNGADVAELRKAERPFSSRVEFERMIPTPTPAKGSTGPDGGAGGCSFGGLGRDSAFAESLLMDTLEGDVMLTDGCGW